MAPISQPTPHGAEQPCDGLQSIARASGSTARGKWVRHRDLDESYESQQMVQKWRREAHAVVRLRSPFGPVMSARRRDLSLRSTGRSRPIRFMVVASSSGSSLMISKYAKLHFSGASLEGWTVSALHSMKKGSSPWRSSARLTVFQVRTRPS